jgi:viologen exporter family transport system permease protein
VHLLRAAVRAQAQYRLSFAVDAVGTSFGVLLDILSVLVFFRVTRSLAGFPFREAFLMAGLATCGFSLADMVASNVLLLQFNVRTGRLDALLVRPLGVLPQLLVMDFAPRRIGRVVQGLVVYGIALRYAGLDWTPARVALAVLAPLSGGVFYSALFVAGASVAFWWIESTEFASAFTYGGRDFAAYPLTVYNGLFRWLFGYSLGFAFAAYYPALALLGRADPLHGPDWFGWCAPLVALAAAVAAGAIWRLGVRHYRSTGS